MISYSIELFPPRSGSPDLLGTLELTCGYPVQPPSFVSLTCRHGSEQVTLQLATRLQAAGYRVAAHMLHLGYSQKALREMAGSYYQRGIRHIVALRGDLSPEWPADPHGFPSTIEFVGALRQWHPDMEISVAGYPDSHPEAESWQQDLEFLQHKTDAGADRVLTQLFFSPHLFIRYLQRARNRGIHVPIVPGLMPITNFTKTQRFTQRCQVSVPGSIHRLFALEGNGEQAHLLAMALLTSQVQQLYQMGVTHFHFYMLNMPLLLRPLLHWIGCCQDSSFSPTSPLVSALFRH